MQATVATSIDAPPAVAFAVTADIARWPERITAIRRVEMLTEGPVGKGARFRETRLMFGREASEEMTVAEMAPPERLVLVAHNHGTDYRVTHTFAPEGRGTRATLRFEGRPTTLLARLCAPIGVLMAGTVRRQLEGDLADLKRAIEAGGRPGAAAGAEPG